MKAKIVVWAIGVTVASSGFAQHQRPDRVSEIHRLSAILGASEVAEFSCEITYTYNPGDRSGTKWKIVGTLQAKRFGSHSVGGSNGESGNLAEHFGIKPLPLKAETVGIYGVRFDGRVWPDVMYTENNRNIPGWECTMILNEKNEVATKCIRGDSPPTGQQPSSAALESYFSQIQRLPGGDWVKTSRDGPIAFDYSTMDPKTYRPGIGGSQEMARITIQSISHAALDPSLFSLDSMKSRVDWAMVAEHRERGKPWPALPPNPSDPAEIPNACRPASDWPPGRIDEAKLGRISGGRYSLGRQEVHVWASRGETEKLREVVLKSQGGSYSVWTQDGFGFTPLNYAAANGRFETVRFLLGSPTRGYSGPGNVLEDISLRSSDTMGPLHLAAIYGHADVIRELLKTGVPPDGTDYRGNTALDYAAAAGQAEAIKALLSNEESPNRSATVASALRCAIEGNKPASVNALCRRVDKKIQLGPLGTVLHYAAQSGNLDVVRCLIKNVGCRPTCFNKDGQTPLFFAGNGEVATFLIAEDPEIVNVLDRSRQSSAHSLAARNNLSALRVVVQKSSKLAKAADEKGREPLVYAVFQGSVESAALLLEAGANPAVRVNDEAGIAGFLGWGVTKLAGRRFSDWILSDDASLLHVAARTGDREMTKILVSKGLDFDDKDGCQRTPLLVAIQHGQVDYALWLLSDKNGLSKTPPASVATTTGVEPIHLAAKIGNVALIEALIKRGANVNASVGSIASITAIADLKSAIRSCHPGMIWGSTPLDIARAEEQWEAAEFLRRQGAKESDELNP